MQHLRLIEFFQLPYEGQSIHQYNLMRLATAKLGTDIDMRLASIVLRRQSI